MTGVDTDLATLRRAFKPGSLLYNGVVRIGDVVDRVEAELSRLREALDNGDRLLSQAGRALEAAEARCARLQQALEAIAQDDDLVHANEDAFSIHAYRRCVAQAREALAGPDTPACDHEWVQEHGTSGRYCVVCGAGPDTPADERPTSGVDSELARWGRHLNEHLKPADSQSEEPTT